MPSTSMAGLPAGFRTPHPRTSDASSTALAALRTQLAALVAMLMGVEGSWKTDPADANGWWLVSWGKRLTVERLEPPLATDVLAWLTDTQSLLNHGYSEHLDPLLIEHANRLRERAAILSHPVAHAVADLSEKPDRG